MEKMLAPLSNDQRKYLIDSAQVYESYLEAYRQAANYRYGMSWKKSNGKSYLFRASGRDGNGKSLGPKSSETEQIFSEFHVAKTRNDERLQSITARLNEFARINKALRLGRLPTVVAKLMRNLDELGMLGEEFMVLGTQCLFAYEAAAGVRIDPSLTASGDVDLMFDARKRITIASRKLDGEGLIGLLRKIDKTFAPMQMNTFRAANAQEFMVDLITPPREMRQCEPIRLADDDLIAVEVPGLEWLMNSPRFSAVCIGEDGWPCRMVVPDPRAFCVHKAWLSKRIDRDPIKKPRDLGQANIIRQLTQEYLPYLPFDEKVLKAFPEAVRNWRFTEGGVGG